MIPMRRFGHHIRNRMNITVEIMFISHQCCSSVGLRMIYLRMKQSNDNNFSETIAATNTPYERSSKPTMKESADALDGLHIAVVKNSPK